ncbi:unnamed protein product [Lymnaea stagnalis]|uniref:G-protein coupled receptors family 1 profile domain-containing protein n=1 Tax=Lymnaea stagnalis TaxID=6523 RepID=A0AAV2HXY6_LYMST
MIILSRLGLKSSMWVGGFALSLTDFIVTTLQIAVSCCYILNYVYPESDVDMVMLGVFALGSIRYAGFYISMWITTVISVERCFCVVFPFKVKRLFTRSRCVFAIVVIYCVYFSLILPVYIFEKIAWIDIYSIQNNVTVKKKLLTAIYSEESLNLEIIIDTIGAVALSVTSQAILIVCTIWMTCALKASSNIRQNKESLYDPNKSAFKIKTSELSTRERKLIKVVIGLAFVLTFCNIPRYGVLAAYLSIPGLTGEEYKHLGAFMWDISDFFGTLNCSSNFFVYWFVNSHFRNSLKQLFRLGPTERQ